VHTQQSLIESQRIVIKNKLEGLVEYSKGDEPATFKDPPYSAILIKVDGKADFSTVFGRLKELSIVDDPHEGKWSDGNQTVWAARNTVDTEKNPLRHAELKVLEMAHKEIYPTEISPRSDFYIFVNTESCPMCMTGIIKAHIYNVFFFGMSFKLGKPPGPFPNELARQTNAAHGEERYRVEHILL